MFLMYFPKGLLYFRLRVLKVIAAARNVEIIKTDTQNCLICKPYLKQVCLTSTHLHFQVT